MALAQVVGLGVVGLFVAQTAAGVGGADGEEVVETLRTAEGVGGGEQVYDGAGAEFQGAVGLAVEACGDGGEVAVFARAAQAAAELFDEVGTAVFVAVVAGEDVCRGGAFAEVVDQGGKADNGRWAEGGGLFEYHQDVYAGVDFAVVLFRLGDAEQLVQFRE